MRYFLFGFCWAVSFASFGQQESSPDGFAYLTGDQIASDLDSLSAWILKLHPAPFAQCAPEEWTASLDKNKRLARGGGNVFTAAKAYSDLMSLLKDSHTGIALQSFANTLASSNGQIPIEIATVENKTVVVQDWSKELDRGAVVSSIAGISSRSLLGMSLSIVSQEGDALVSRVRMADKLWNDLAPFALGASVGDTLSLILGVNDSLPSKTSVVAKAYLDSIKLAADKRDVSWERLPEHPDIIHLTIRSFHPEQERKFKRELKHCFQAIYRAEKKSENAITGIVLDLRQNSGGHIALMAEVLPYLASEATRIPYGAQIKHSDIARDQLSHPWIGGSVFSFGYDRNFMRLNKAIRDKNQHSMSFVPFENPITPKKRLNYAGPVVMVLDGLSASASVSFAAWFVRSGRGKTIGEPPMGGISGTFGNPVRLTLPSSKLQFNVATARYYTEEPIRWQTKPLLPDFPIAMTIEDHQLHRDPFLEKAVEWLHHAE